MQHIVVNTDSYDAQLHSAVIVRGLGSQGGRELGS